MRATFPKIWGHRGCRGPNSPPENSLAAFGHAIEQGAGGIELDVFLSRDGHLVVFHDDTLDRMTNGQGLVTSFTLAELKELRLRGEYDNLTQQAIPTLEEVFGLVEERASELFHASAPGFVVNIEIKGSGIADHVGNAVTKLLDRDWRYRNILVSSFDMRSLGEMRALNADIPIGLLFEGPLESPREPWNLSLPELEECLLKFGDLHPQSVNITLPSLTPEAATRIKALGAVPVGWTCNEINPDALVEDERRALASHVRDNDITFITDFPGPMINLLANTEHKV